MERNPWKYVIAAIAGASIFVLVIGWSGVLSEGATAQECDLMGMTMLNDKPYKCSRIVPEQGEG